MAKKTYNLLYPIIFILCIFLVFYLISLSLNPLNQNLFDFHDDTQLVRIHEFVLNLKNAQIPPRLAPELSFNLGFPIFNYYAPFGYWVTGLIAFAGISSVYALKISFILTVILSFIGMYLFLRNFFSFFSSLLGATAYITSTYFAVEIMIRGNLAECWYLALLPIALHLLIQNSKKKSKKIFILSVLTLSFLFTSHNVFSLISITIIFNFILLLPNRFKNIYSIILSFLIAGYFLIPSLLELHLTHAVTQAKLARYQDHFLCAWQLWQTNGWHYGGSVPGCDGDQMSFQLGKIPTIMAFFGFVTLIWQIIVGRGREIASATKNVAIFIAILTLISLFLTLYQSQFIWDRFAFILAIFQFPWRFMVFGMFGVGFLAAYFFNHIKLPFKTVIILTIIVFSFLSGRKYFGKPLYDPKTYNDLYNSQKFRETKTAFKIREYLTHEADPAFWWSLNSEIPEYKPITFNYKQPIESKSKFTILKNNYFEKLIKTEKPGEIKINIHYFPFWKIYINNKEYIPNKFDKLGRPIVKLSQSSTVLVIYKQTFIENTGNFVTILGLILLIVSQLPFFKFKTPKALFKN